MTRPHSTLKEQSLSMVWSKIKNRRNGGNHVKFDLKRNQLELIKKRDLCPYCKKNKTNTIDHIIPCFKGGFTTSENLIACCWDCNIHKGLKFPFEWIQNKKLPFYSYIQEKNISLKNLDEEVNSIIVNAYKIHNIEINYLEENK